MSTGPEPLPPAAQRVQDALLALGRTYVVHQLDRSTRTAAEAADAVGCQVGQIAKSLVFRGQSSGRPVLAIASGANRVSEVRLAELLGEPVGKATPDFVREATGFAIGGVPPVGHASPLPIYIDEDLLQFELIWAAAGTPHTVFPLPPSDLPALTNGRVATLRAG
jgi:prolyl-tRNA editing enzyme YbaK/EbsC (Cys-tRNA(Pro) deacylase)